MTKTLKDIKTEAKVASKLVPVEPPVSSTSITEKVSKRTFSEEQVAQYLQILSDGKPHKIQDLLKTFDLPSTTSGREKLRAANRLIGKTGTHSVVGLFPDGVEGKHFQLIENANGNKVIEAVPAPAPIEETITQ